MSRQQRVHFMDGPLQGTQRVIDGRLPYFRVYSPPSEWLPFEAANEACTLTTEVLTYKVTGNRAHLMNTDKT